MIDGCRGKLLSTFLVASIGMAIQPGTLGDVVSSEMGYAGLWLSQAIPPVQRWYGEKNVPILVLPAIPTV